MARRSALIVKLSLDGTVLFVKVSLDSLLPSVKVYVDKESSMNRQRAREALERDLARHRDHPTPAPPRGWLRAIRDALGMSVRDLAGRAGVSFQRVSQIEQAETDGSVTLATLERMAEALGCRLEYTLVPERPLDELVRDQARRKAATMLAGVDHSMALEQQRTDTDVRHRELDRLTEHLIDSRDLWSV